MEADADVDSSFVYMEFRPKSARISRSKSLYHLIAEIYETSKVMLAVHCRLITCYSRIRRHLIIYSAHNE